MEEHKGRAFRVGLLYVRCLQCQLSFAPSVKLLLLKGNSEVYIFTITYSALVYLHCGLFVLQYRRFRFLLLLQNHRFAGFLSMYFRRNLHRTQSLFAAFYA